MKNLIPSIMIALISLSCASNKSTGNCEVKKVSSIVVENDNLYYMKVIFNNCDTKELRETLIKKEMKDRFPLTKDRIIHVEEYLGKMYNEYRYKINIE